jgi:hypothetical protein
MFALFILYSSFFFLLVGISVALGAVLDRSIASTVILILPSFFSIFSQGALSQTFADAYPGAIGQIMASLLIDNVSKKEWDLFAISMFINILVGFFGFYFFIVKMGNYNPIANLCGKGGNNTTFSDGNDIDTSNGDNVLLEGRGIIKIYGVGKKSSSSFRALDDVTFAIKEGSLLGLVGKSGAGVSQVVMIFCYHL